MIHVCILSTMHPSDDGRVTHKLGAMLVKGGFRVTWVGPTSNRNVDFPGIRFLHYPGVGRSRIRRLAQARNLENACLRIPDIETVNVFFAVEPDSAAVSIRLARRYGARSVFDIQEMYHREMLNRWVPSWLRPVAGHIVRARMKWLCRHVDLCVGAGFTRIAPYESVARQHMVVRHCLPRKTIEQYRAHPFGSSKSVIRIMHGKPTLHQGTKEVIEGVAKAHARLGAVVQIKLFCIDQFEGYRKFDRAAFEDYVDAHKMHDMIELHPPVPFHEMFPLLSTCDIGVIAYNRDFGVHCIPNRIFEYMAVGLPVIVPNYSVEIQAIMENYPCGIAVDMENSDEITDAIVRLVTNPGMAREMGECGRKAALEKLNMEAEIAPLIEWIKAEAV